LNRIVLDLLDFDSGILREPILDLLLDLLGRYFPHGNIRLTEREYFDLHFSSFLCFFAERSSSGTGGAAESMNEVGDIQITVGSDTTTSAPPVVQQRHCSACSSLWPS
jgi:hypothetical protein